MTDILVFAKQAFPSLPEAGVWPVDGWPDGGAWRPRAQVEVDEDWLQPIPYLLIRNAAGGLWCYRRDGGDGRLQGRSSCGIGGHVERVDAGGDVESTLMAACLREVGEELANGHLIDNAQPHAWLHERRSAIGRVHVGLIVLADWSGGEPPRIADGEDLTGIGFMPPETIRGDTGFELWSRLAASWLIEADS